MGRNESSNWFPRLPAPMMIRRTFSLAAAPEAIAGAPRSVAAPAAVPAVSTNSRRLIGSVVISRTVSLWWTMGKGGEISRWRGIDETIVLGAAGRCQGPAAPAVHRRGDGARIDARPDVDGRRGQGYVDGVHSG